MTGTPERERALVDGDKENHTASQPKDDPVQNRRESFGKGILKNLTKKDENATVSLPLRDTHHTGRLSLDGKAFGRRVSFAPEVTLHKIDLIPKSVSPEHRQPRRRETIAFLPHTPRDLSPVPSSSNNQEYEGEEIIYDSSDVEMEVESQIYSSPGRPGFTIHQDDEGFTGTIDMSLTRFGDGTIEEDTMDLTKPLGSIQMLLPSLSNGSGGSLKPQGGIQTSTQNQSSSQESISSESQRPFGSIKCLFADEEDEEEVDMELTLPVSMPLENSAESIQGSTPVRQDGIHATEDEDSLAEEMMDITSLADASMDPVTLQNTLHNRQIQATSDHDSSMDVTMEQTKALGSILTTKEHAAAIMDSTTEMTMDETRLSTTIRTQKGPETGKSMTPLKANRSHTSETGSPMSSKRKSIPDSESLTNDLRARINMLTPKKKRRTLSLDHAEIQSVPIASFEHFQTALSSQLSLSVEQKSAFTPLRTSNDGIRKSIMNGGKVEFPLSQKVPLAPSHEQDAIDDVLEYQPVSLTQFLNDLSIEFFDDLNINDDFTVEFKTLPPAKKVHPLDYIIAKSTKIPWLELYSFSCDELQKNMKELKGLFDDLDAEFSEENPRLVRDYYETTSIAQQKKMSDTLIRMKQYSDYESEKAWSTWREKLLDELQIRLQKNLDNMINDQKLLESSTEKIKDILSHINQNHDSLELLVEKLVLEKAATESPDADKLIKLRAELLSEFTSLQDEKEELSTLLSELEALEEQAVDTTALEKDIEEMQIYVKRQSQDPLLRLNQELATFDALQKISGLAIESLSGSSITLILSESSIRVCFDLLNPESITISLPDSIIGLKRVFMAKYLARSTENPPHSVIHGLHKLYKSLDDFESDLFGIGLLCPCKVDVGSGVTVELVEFNRAEKYKAQIKIQFNEQSMLSGCYPQSVKAKLVYGPKRLDEQTILSNLKLKSTKSCFIRDISSITMVYDQ